MNQGNHADMHRDHEHWLADVAMWRDDIDLWKEECQKALSDQTDLEIAFRRLVHSIGDHEAHLDRHVDKITAQEHSVSEFERTLQGDTADMLTFAKAHKMEAGNHEYQRRIHERLKKELHTLMGHQNTLVRELTKTGH
jgi:hypothetical protein